MSKEKKHSIKAEYEKIRITGWRSPFSKKNTPIISISLRELGYDPHAADVNFTLAEANEIINLIKQAIKEATKKEKK